MANPFRSPRRAAVVIALILLASIAFQLYFWRSEAFAEAARAYEARNPGTEVSFCFWCSNRVSASGRRTTHRLTLLAKSEHGQREVRAIVVTTDRGRTIMFE
ncbi:hypothetical protein GCM10027188_29030 [Lysobacter humi (ex Lee et al. 2017)]